MRKPGSGNDIPDGSAGNPTIVLANPGDTVTLKVPNSVTPGIEAPGSGGTGGPDPIVRPLFFQGKNYITIDGINLDGNDWRAWDCIKTEASSSNIILQNLFITDGWNSGYKLNDSSNCELHNCVVWQNGQNDFRHGVYWDGDGHKIWNCDVYENAGWGIAMFGGASNDNLDIRYNRSWANGRLVGPRGDGIYTTGDNCIIANNLVWDNAQGGIVFDNGSDNKCYNNTVYAQGNNGSWLGIHLKGSGHWFINQCNSNGERAIHDCRS